MPGTPTTKYAIPTFNAAGSDPVNTGHTQINNALTTLDGAMAGYATGTFAGKPAAGKAGRFYLCTDTGQWLADTGSVWVDLNSAPTFVSSLPGSPYDGQEIYYQAIYAGGAEASIWHLRYRAAVPVASKWEFVGGGSLTAEVLTTETVSVLGGYGDLATVGPSITVPLAGDYEIVLASRHGAGTNGITYASVKFGAATALDADSISSGPSPVQASLSRSIRRNVSSAGQVVKMVYQATTAAGQAQNRNLSIRPIRVG